MRFDRYDIALAKIADSEGFRPILQNLHLTNGKSEVSNEFMMATRDVDLREGEDKPDALIPAKMFKGTRTVKGKRPFLVVDNGWVIISYHDEKGKAVDFEPNYSFKTYNADISYPNIDKLFEPVKVEKKAHIALRVGLLKRLLSTMPDEGMLRIGITEPDKPMEFECSNMDRPIRGLLMPMYTDWEEFKWHRNSDENTEVK